VRLRHVVIRELTSITRQQEELEKQQHIQNQKLYFYNTRESVEENFSIHDDDDDDDDDDLSL
jgi:hypothetical protein